MAACVGGMALAWGVGGFTALHAASRDVTLTPPYTAAEHNTNVHCPDSEPWAVCGASAEVDAATGHMALSSIRPFRRSSPLRPAWSASCCRAAPSVSPWPSTGRS